MKKYTYINRHNEKITFQQTKAGNYKVFFNSAWSRVGRNDKNKIEFIDPSGGPFINLGDFYFGKGENKFSEHITQIFPKSYGALIRVNKK